MANPLHDDIVSCNECALRKLQEPIIDDEPKGDNIIMFVDLSAIKVRDARSPLARPFSLLTPTGKILARAEEALSEHGFSFYHTNLVKCPPLDNGHLRNPTNYETEACFDNLLMEIDYYLPTAVFLMGQGVYMPVLNLLGLTFRQWSGYYFEIYTAEDICYIPTWHPEYINLQQKRNINTYIDGLINAVKRCDPAAFEPKPKARSRW
ncbi:MAG: hypothetical protein IJ849_08665 [Selenomonadaceae bacterium]|nr:hypothetical protein [Selenomonadaceae bacterium]